MSFIILLIAFGALLSSYFFKIQKGVLHSEFDIRANALLGSMSASCEYPVLVGNKKSLEKMGRGILDQEDVVLCEIIDNKGDLLFREGSKTSEYTKEYVSPILTEEFIESTNEALILGFEEKETKDIGRIRLVFSQASLRDKLSATKKTVGTLMLTSIIFAAVFIALLIRFILSRPIEHLVRGTEMVSSGDLSHKVQLKSRDEIGILARSFNKMIEDLEKTTVSRDYLNNIIGSMTDCLIVASLEGKINRVNQAVLDLLGYDEKELIGQDLAALFVEEERRDIMKGVKGLGLSFNSEGHERHFRTCDGRAISVLISWSMMKNAVGNITNLVCVAKDITKLINAEQALRQSEERLRLAGKAAYDLIYEWSVEKNELNWFGDIDKTLGYKSGEITKTIEGWLRLIHPDDRSSLKAFLDIHKTSPQPIKYEYRIRRKDGSFRYWLDSAVPQLDYKERPYMWIGVCTDITERKQADEQKAILERQLQQSQKMEAIGTLAGGIAHDFNNILAAIIGYTELAIHCVPKESSVHKNLREVMVAGIRAKDLVKQILTFSRQTEHELKPIQVKPIVEEVLKLLRASLPTTICFRKNIESDSVVMADSTHIHQILMNLCTNAGHAMQEKGGILEVTLTDIELDARCEELLPGAYLRLTVSDTGIGMDALMIKRIFDPYFTTKEKGKGTGMGLAVVHGILKSYGGKIDVYSEPGNGSTFHVYLPVKEMDANAEERVEVSLPTGKECILFVDDEQSMANLGKELLEGLGYNVVTRTSSLEALEAFRAQSDNFDLVITDMTMPNMTGEKMAREIMKVRPDMPIILCTGFSPVITEEKARAMGIRAFIMKPILKNEIAVKIREVLDGSNIEADNPHSVKGKAGLLI
jgi:PAS domain S-box-containing protein